MKTGYWVVKNKETHQAVAVCIIEDSPTGYTTAKGTFYLKADWEAVTECSASLVL